MSSKSQPYRNVVLGFLEDATQTEFLPHEFPSKVGGQPIWLYRSPNTPPQVPRCVICLQPQVFLLQIYAPLETQVVSHHSGFHRMLYIAICKSPSCLKDSRCVTVLRAQLPRQNDYYPFSMEQSEDDEEIIITTILDATCELCGFKAQSQCGACHQVSYCSKRCQAADWKLGHKAVCNQGDNDNDMKKQLVQKRTKWLYNEWKIVTDTHPTPPDSDSDDFSDSDVETEKEINTLDQPTNSILTGTFQDADEDELPEELFRGKDGKKKDPLFRKFCRLVSYEPDQIIRYHHGGTPLWSSEKSQCQRVECCEQCGGERIFEMQIMPQLVYFLNKNENDSDGNDKKEMSIEQIATRMRDDMDWSTIVVYTCGSSCQSNEKYVREFAWVQCSSSR